jgi:hypothetical protein
MRWEGHAAHMGTRGMHIGFGRRDITRKTIIIIIIFVVKNMHCCSLLFIYFIHQPVTSVTYNFITYPYKKRVTKYICLSFTQHLDRPNIKQFIYIVVSMVTMRTPIVFQTLLL